MWKGRLSVFFLALFSYNCSNVDDVDEQVEDITTKVSVVNINNGDNIPLLVYDTIIFEGVIGCEIIIDGKYKKSLSSPPPKSL